MKKLLLIMLNFAVAFFFSDSKLFAQTELELKWSIPGVPAQNFIFEIIGFQSKNHLDFNGDEVPDIPFLRTDSEGNVSLGVKDGDGNVDGADFLAWITLPNGIIAILIGFYDLDGPPNESSLKEIIMATKMGNKYINPIVIRSDDDYNTFQVDAFEANSVFVAAGDVNGDGMAEILTYDQATPKIYMWGY